MDDANLMRSQKRGDDTVSCIGAVATFRPSFGAKGWTKHESSKRQAQVLNYVW